MSLQGPFTTTRFLVIECKNDGLEDDDNFDELLAAAEARGIEKRLMIQNEILQAAA